MDLKALKSQDLAQLLNVSSTTIYNMTREEIPLPYFIPEKEDSEKGATKRFDWHIVLKWYLERQKRNILVDAPSKSEDTLEEAKLRKLSAEADLAEIEVLAVRKEYLPAKDVEALWVKAVANSRSKLLLAPITAAKRIYPEMELAEREAVIEEVLHSALMEMSTLDINEEVVYE